MCSGPSEPQEPEALGRKGYCTKGNVEILEHYRPSVKVGQPKETGSGEREMNISKPKSIFMKQEHFKA